MRYFLDTEFIEDGKTIDLISIGIVSDKFLMNRAAAMGERPSPV